MLNASFITAILFGPFSASQKYPGSNTEIFFDLVPLTGVSSTKASSLSCNFGTWSGTKVACFPSQSLHHSSALLLLDDDHVFDKSPAITFDVSGEINVQKSPSCVGRKRKCRSRIHGRHVLSPVVVAVFKSLNWDVTRELKFSRTMKKYGFSRSIDAFRMLVSVFALAGMDMQVYALLRDIV